ncbi:MAG: ASKHA domain-containing protein [Candidatus Bathyarchaeia archaeon]
MNEQLTVIFEPYGRRVKVKPGTSIFEAARKAGVRIKSECGGRGFCGKCKVVVADKNGLNDLTETEKRLLSQGEVNLSYRLACCALVKQNVSVMIPKDSMVGALKVQAWSIEPQIALNPLINKYYLVLSEPTLDDATPDLERLVSHLITKYGLDGLEVEYEVLKELPLTLRLAEWKVTVTIWHNRRIISVEKGNTADKIMGVAIDIGTSKIVGCLVNLKTGKVLAVSFIENPQIMFGEDIISRINYVANDDRKCRILHRLLIEGVNDVINHLCSQADVDPKYVYEAVIVGNTAMHHFLLGFTPKHVAISPFAPVTRGPIDIKAENLGIKINPCGFIHVLPIIAGFVGADALADVLSSGIHESKHPSMLMDIGTNTEIFVGNSEDLLSCSCASGPAFEGAHIKHGVKAIAGAIEKVSIKPDSGYDVEYETIGNVEPVGICGSAMIDIIAEFFRYGIINSRGRFNTDLKTPRLRVINGDVEFVIAWKGESGTGSDITVTQRDINEIQLAKAAIFAGCWIMMKRKNLTLKDLDQVMVAGSFGSYINPENAKLAGLVPDVPTDKIRFIGNTALAGAKMALLSWDARKTAEELPRRIRYLELARDPEFASEFAGAMFIPHRNLNRFPSVMKSLNPVREA